MYFLNQKLIKEKFLNFDSVLEEFKNEILNYKEVMKVYKTKDFTYVSKNDFNAQMALKGKNHKRKIITQIAPSLSQKLKIPFPSTSNTEILGELF